MTEIDDLQIKYKDLFLANTAYKNKVQEQNELITRLERENEKLKDYIRLNRSTLPP